MATARTSFPRPNLPLRPLRTVRRTVLVLTGAIAVSAGIAFVPQVASAAPDAPATAKEAAELMAARAHDLEVVTEQFNTARSELETQQAAAKAAADAVAKAQADLATAQAQVRGIARSAFTGGTTNGFSAMMTSDSADEFVDKMSTLQMVADHQNAILDQVAAASQAAAQAQTVAAKSAADAQSRYDKVAAQQADLQAQVNKYQADFSRLSAAEQQAAVQLASTHGSDRASRDDRSEPAPTGPIVADSAAAQTAVDTAMAQRGKPYVWAAAGPSSFDCSGLVLYAYKAAGISLPHSSLQQSRMGQAVSRSDLRPGDLIFFYSPVSHVGIYIGNGQMVHAPTSGDVVKVASIDAVGGITAMRRIAG
ncbi:C40 family peptidase [Petropleomorpha daqingensis]|uniref:Cell wall-associated NlpC family hydrolase n=1 Tax=Petropleomorpha daqingensis TaxID=2026353 RepID=A0A853CBQ1_9ACTN|nr:C40 family peptidase [Petropleomorpha daqingensis]NYJ05164.1 cell wall-associated NlpC family hydrolase [Petropleomorpha daqingensis]